MGQIHLKMLLPVLFFSAVTALASAQTSLQDLEGTPFLVDGIPYRDMLTIGASQAVATFASSYQPEEKEKIFERQRGVQGQEPASPQFYSSTLAQPIGSPDASDTIDFAASRRIRPPATLLIDRALADRDEAELTAADRAPLVDSLLSNSLDDGFVSASPTGSSIGLGRGRPRTSRLRQAPPKALTGANYQRVIGHGLSYTTGARGASYSTYPSPAAAAAYPTAASYPAAAYPVPTSSSTTLNYAPTATAVYTTSTSSPASFTPFDFTTTFGRAPQHAASLSRKSIDYNIQVHHGDAGGSYSYSTFG